MTMYENTCIFCRKVFSRKGKRNQKYCSVSCGSQNKNTDINIFSEINDISAYILGFIFADGNLSIYLDEKSNKMRRYLTISSSDEDLSREIHKLITPNKKLYIYLSKGTGLCKNSKIKIGYNIKTCQEDIINSIIELGVSPRKSNSMTFPNLDKKFIGSFIRGYFDGDGTVGFMNIKSGNKIHNYLKIKFTSGSILFLEELAFILNSFEIKTDISQDKRSNAFYLCSQDKKSIKRFYNLIYSTDGISLKRKKERFENFYSASPVIF